MTPAVPSKRDPDSGKQQEFDQAMARIDKALIVLRKKAAQRKKPPSQRFPGAQRMAAQAYLQGAVTESYPPNGTLPLTNGNGVEPEKSEET